MQAGLSGAIAIHAIYSTDETVLFFERPHVGAANSGVTPNPYLTVSQDTHHDLSPPHPTLPYHTPPLPSPDQPFLASAFVLCQHAYMVTAMHRHQQSNDIVGQLGQ